MFGIKEKVINNIICSESEFRERLKIERSRTHRNCHEFSLVTFNLKSLKISREQTDKIIQKICSRIRDIDTIGWYDKDKIGVILPYTSAKGANEFAKKIIDSIKEKQQESKYSLITYPPEKKTSKDKETKPVLRSM
jgi:GGDEF domain-containing protein